MQKMTGADNLTTLYQPVAFSFKHSHHVFKYIEYGAVNLRMMHCEREMDAVNDKR